MLIGVTAKQFSFSSKLSLFTNFMNQLYNPMIVSRLEAAYHVPNDTADDGTGVPGLMLGNNMLMGDGGVEGDIDSGPLARGAIYAWINAVVSSSGGCCLSGHSPFGSS
jgi:hypothetical protein